MLVDPRTLLTNWQLLAAVTGLILVGKSVIWFAIVRLFGYPAKTALRVGVGLTQIGELSFLLAQVSLHSALITEPVYNAILAGSLLTILTNALLFKLLKDAPGALLPAMNAADA